MGPSPERLAAAVKARRTSLNRTQAQINEHGGPSTETQRLIEGAKQLEYGAATLNRLDRALEWRLGTSAALLHRDFSPDDDARVQRWIGTGAQDVQLLDHLGLGPVHHHRAIVDTARATDSLGPAAVRPNGIASAEEFGTPTVRDVPASAVLTGSGALTVDDGGVRIGALSASDSRLFGLVNQAIALLAQRGGDPDARAAVTHLLRVLEHLLEESEQQPTS